ncbi:hypothetical protein H9P43_004564 [Blastocladiella emersonii ATCC 22665]|nr:hypothetical protein H9P43_004564 [Blastocladiella emersonii ATCC 22665]
MRTPHHETRCNVPASAPSPPACPLPPVGLGTWGAASPDVLADAVTRALELGYRHIDTAWVYDNAEVAVGAGLARWLAAPAADPPRRREDVFVTTKLWVTWMHPSRVADAVSDSLRRLQIDYLDLLLVHWPLPVEFHGADVTNPVDEHGKWRFDTATMLEATWAAMEALVDQGLVRHLGLSNVTLDHLKRIQQVARIPPTVVQNEMHPYLPQRDLVEYCHAHAIVPVAYSPLGSPSSVFTKDTAPKLLDDPMVKGIAERHACSPARVLLAWALQRGTAVIPKSTSPARLAENLDAGSLGLSDMEMVTLGALQTRKRYFDPRSLFGVDLFGEGDA